MADPVLHGVISLAEAAEATRALVPVLPAALLPLFDATFIRSDHLYDEFVTRLALHVFRTTGLAEAAAEPGTTAEIATRSGLALDRAAVPVDWIVRRLTARGLLEQTDEAPARYRAPGSLPRLDPAVLREEQIREDASWLPSYTLAETVARDYPAFLRGERSGEEIVFSPARLKLWVDFFSNANGLYAVNNHVGAVAAASWLPPGAVRIVELGAGLGSAAISLLDELRRAGRWADIVEYRFTDIVPTFLRRGQAAVERHCPDVPFLTVAPVDMNRPLGPQGIEPGSCHLVYAVNTLHVARDLRATLGEIREALAPGGMLVISECVRLVPGQTIYAEFVFNLLESFRSPVLDREFRPNGGFLTPTQWRTAMAVAGFDAVRCLPDIDHVQTVFPTFYLAAVGAARR